MSTGAPERPSLPAGHRGVGGTVGVGLASGSVTEDDIASLVELAHGLMYSGFDTVRFRNLVRERIPAKDLLKVLVAAAMVGNAPERLAGKISNPDTGRNTLTLLNQYQIRSKGAVGANDLTLARVAACCAPLYYAVRIKIQDSLQDQGLNTGVVKSWQSPSLAAYADVTPGLHDWLLAFGRRIKPKSESIEMSDLRAAQFMEISTSNKTRDKFLAVENLSKSIPELLALMYKA